MMEKTESTLVSVITIFFNAEKFIIEAIESIINQTYTNWELLLVDDGSTDRSSGIAKQFSLKYPLKIKYLEHRNHQNLGMSTSRNLGIDNSKGELVCFLDADDIWLPKKLEEQTRIMNENPDVNMLYGNTIFWWSWSTENKKKDYVRKLGIKPNSKINPPDLVPLFLIVSAAVPGTCSIMCRKSLFIKVRFEDSFTGLYEDQAFYYKVCLSEKIYVSDQIWDKYRQHPESACYVAEKNEKLYALRSSFLIWLWEYIKVNNFNNTKISVALCQEFWKNKTLQQIKNSKSSEKIRWIFKWFFRIENFFLPYKFSLYFWQKSRTYDYLSSLPRITTQSRYVIWDPK